jgi:two-component system phosphate regulon response regulator OmpR
MALRTSALLIDDDARLGTLMTEYLGKHEIDVVVAGDGTRGLAALRKTRTDIVLLDIMLPGMDGLEVCRKIRATPDCATLPVIMLTAKGEDVDRIVGLEMGADDYLAKPFNPRELVARIHAVLRRHTERMAPGAPALEGKITFGPYRLDLTTRTLLRGGTVVPLTTGEFGLLRVLATHPRQPLAREKLMLLARGRDHDVFDRAIDVQVSRLRKLIEIDVAAPRYIQTVWGFGYVFVPDASPSEMPVADSGA